MSIYDEKLNELKEHEKTLQFTEFNNATALKIGLGIVERAQKENKVIAVDITRNGQQLFHYSFDGITPDHDQWIARKNRIVNRFHKSSLFMETLMKKIGKPLEETFYISPIDYAADGGAFPLIVKNVGVIGTITVSGLTGDQDHEMIVTAIKNHLEIQ